MRLYFIGVLSFSLRFVGGDEQPLSSLTEQEINDY